MKVKLTRCVIINKDTLNFLGENGEEIYELEYAPKYETIAEANEELSKCDNSSDFEIRLLDITFDLKEIYE